MLALVASALALPAKEQAALLAPESAAAACTCTTTASPTSTCVTKGDPHFTTFGGVKYDFMATGTYQLLKAPTTCGCDVEIQTFMFASASKPSASYNIAVAMQAGTTTFVVSGAAATLSVYESGSLTGTYDAAASSAITVADLDCTPSTAEKKGKIVGGWTIEIPGGGSLQAWAFSKDLGAGADFGAILGISVSAPGAMVGAAAGLCAQQCKGKPPLPNEQCGEDVCLPVFTTDAVFPASVLSNLESSGTGISTRPSGVECVDVTTFSPPPSPPPPMTASPAPSGGSCDASWTQYRNCNEGAARKDIDDSYSFGSNEDDFEVCRAFCEAKGAAGCCKLNTKNDNCDWFEGTEHYSAVVDKANRYTIMCSGTSSSAPPPPPPPPATPGVTTCGQFDTSKGGQWLSNIQVTEWYNASSVHDCSAWCLQQTVDSCKIKSALMLAGVELRCAYIDGGAADSETGESGSCAAVAGEDMTVTSVSSSLYFVAPVACNVNKYGIVPCDPSPTTVCEDEGIPLATAQVACAEVVSFDECVYDFCASGGDCDDTCMGFGDDPPPPLPPPSRPPSVPPSTPPSVPPPSPSPPPPSPPPPSPSPPPPAPPPPSPSMPPPSVPPPPSTPPPSVPPSTPPSTPPPSTPPPPSDPPPSTPPTTPPPSTPPAGPPLTPPDVKVHGDPMFKNGDTSMHIWLKEGSMTPLLRWKSSEGHSFTLQGKTFSNRGTGNQWFDQMLIRRGAFVLLNATVSPTHRGSMVVTVSRDMARHVSSDVSFATHPTQTLEMHEKLALQDGSVSLAITAAPANKFSSEEERLTHAHLNVAFAGGVPRGATGIFAEMAGVQPMTQETEALLRPRVLKP